MVSCVGNLTGFFFPMEVFFHSQKDVLPLTPQLSGKKEIKQWEGKERAVETTARGKKDGE